MKKMKIGAYQFVATGNIDLNMKAIRKAVSLAAEESVQLSVFPECALTGYPKENQRSPAIEFQIFDGCLRELQIFPRATACICLSEALR